MLLLTVTLVWASEKLFTKLVEEFYPPVIKDFIGYVNKGERYPLIHAIYDLRVRVFQKKLGINKAEETKACSDRRNFGKEVPEDQQVLCSRYDELIDLARAQVAISKVFEPLYLNYEPELLREIEKQKARDAVRIWIRQKLNCLDDHFRCGRDERGMLERVTGFQEETLETYRMLLVNLDKKLFPEEQTLPPVQAMDLETQCDFVQKGKTFNIKQGMVYIEGGPFTMGSEEGPDNEIPKREVHVDGFWIDRCEVTNYQYLLYLGRDPFFAQEYFPEKISRRELPEELDGRPDAPDGGRTEPGGLRFLVCRAVLLQCPGQASTVGSGMGKGRTGPDRRSISLRRRGRVSPGLRMVQEKFGRLVAHCRGKNPEFLWGIRHAGECMGMGLRPFRLLSAAQQRQSAGTQNRRLSGASWRCLERSCGLSETCPASGQPPPEHPF